MNLQDYWTGFERIPGREWVHGWRWTGWAPIKPLEILRIEQGVWQVFIGPRGVHEGSFQSCKSFATRYAAARCEL